MMEVLHGTWDWLSSKQAQSRFRAVRQENWGKPHAVNAGVEMAVGQYIKFLNSDVLYVG